MYPNEKERAAIEKFRQDHNLPKLVDYGMGKEHDPRSLKIYKFISDTDFVNGDFFVFKSGGDADNGEFLMDLLDAYFKEEDSK